MTLRPLPLLLLALLLTGCGSASADPADPVTLRLGYFPNVTHAPAIVGVEEGLLADALGERVSLETRTFNAGSEAVSALFAGGLDVSYLGPGPVINAHLQSRGEAVRIIAGSTSGGAALVVRQGITTPDDLVGTTISSPALGNTQDVALRAWLADQGLSTTLEGGGDVQVLPQPNAQALETFRAGGIDGAWVPEPWASRLVEEADGVVLVDERDLWPDGAFATTQLIVAVPFLQAHPDIVADLLRGHVAALDAITADPTGARTITNDAIEALVGERLAEHTIAEAWATLTFTADPIAGSLVDGARGANAVGLLDPVDLDGITDLRLLNELLIELGRDPIDDGGLGT